MCLPRISGVEGGRWKGNKSRGSDYEVEGGKREGDRGSASHRQVNMADHVSHILVVKQQSYAPFDLHCIPLKVME